MLKKIAYLRVRRRVVSSTAGECSQSMLSIFWTKVPCRTTAPTRSRANWELLSQYRDIMRRKAIFSSFWSETPMPLGFASRIISLSCRKTPKWSRSIDMLGKVHKVDLKKSRISRLAARRSRLGKVACWWRRRVELCCSGNPHTFKYVPGMGIFSFSRHSTSALNFWNRRLS